MKNIEKIKEYLVENQKKTINLNLILKYHGKSKVVINYQKKKVKKEILYIGENIPQINSITINELEKLSKLEILKKIRRKIIVTAPTVILTLSKKILAPIGKARKIKSIRILKEEPTRERIEKIVKNTTATITKKSYSLSLGSTPSIEDIDLLIKKLEDQLKENLKKHISRYVLYSTFSKSCQIIR